MAAGLVLLMWMAFGKRLPWPGVGLYPMAKGQTILDLQRHLRLTEHFFGGWQENPKIVNEQNHLVPGTHFFAIGQNRTS